VKIIPAWTVHGQHSNDKLENVGEIRFSKIFSFLACLSLAPAEFPEFCRILETEIESLGHDFFYLTELCNPGGGISMRVDLWVELPMCLLKRRLLPLLLLANDVDCLPKLCEPSESASRAPSGF
jgi:hypothetical protein